MPFGKGHAHATSCLPCRTTSARAALAIPHPHANAMKLHLIALSAIIVAPVLSAAAFFDLSFGGYVPTSSAKEDNSAMARAAIDLKNLLAGEDRVRLIAIHDVETTQIAGKNFRFCLVVKDKSDRYRVSALLRRDLSGRMLLLEWKPNGC